MNMNEHEFFVKGLIMAQGGFAPQSVDKTMPYNFQELLEEGILLQIIVLAWNDGRRRETVIYQAA